MKLQDRIISYWTKRSHDFGELRKKELNSYLGERWLKELLPHIGRFHKRILDVGTGTGFFAFLLAKEGYSVTAIDIVDAMLDEGRLQWESMKDTVTGQVDFQHMDAMHIDAPDESFDVIIARNVTWNLMNVEEAYKEWYRVLAPKGVLINIDGDYGSDFSCTCHITHHVHDKVDPLDLAECMDMIQQMDISKNDRPHWDVHMIRRAGFSRVYLDMALSQRVYDIEDELYNPVSLFSIVARK